MGSCMPWCRISRSRRRRKLSSPAFSGIRVVHLSGYVEEFEEPITVRQVTGKPPIKHFVCSSANLLAFGSKPLSLDAHLESGHLYFLLPHSIFQSDSSPVDLVSLATRLTAVAMRCGPSPKSSPCRTITFTKSSSSPSPSKPSIMSPSVGSSWKPVLETIEEKSFDRRSDLSNDMITSRSR
ncbi:hypothetical protein MRB53_008775 [Persea americana]|uniref:Uncharacterized protein n=1 Tax=Persea americana TaxID=3435 RepID=A0ACC2LM82_PERAE|nr:hypothetical protein MRB53_008775 [Persea americana]|eukprot:TRINITY_DN35676_c0_g1_i1.p1 TRINITY_DN35676_c0_g1~~TRINITY_DN35676_c0_g1_i1.p1  ORF type:complete len:181 (+),score=11.53 TRINITY_DN35676_c0_g1_i1:107-649(+)